MLAKIKSNAPSTQVNLDVGSQPCFIGAYNLPDVDVCEDLMLEHAIGNQYEGVMASGEEFVVDKKKKNSLDVNARENSLVTHRYANALQQCLDEYKKQFYYADDVSPYCYESIQLQKYPLGGGFHKWHSERNGPLKSNRHLVFMTYLNTIKDGGETEFFYQKLKVKPRRGLTLIWPADWTHTHRGLPSMTEEKCIVTGWFTFTEESPSVEIVKCVSK